MSKTNVSDEKMVQVARLWSSAQPAVGAMIAVSVIDFHDAEDLVAQVAEVVVRKFDEYDPNRPFTTWAMGIAKNLILQYFQRKGSSQCSYFDETALDAIEQAYLDVVEEVPPRLAALQECLKSIRGKTRQVMELRYQKNLKPEAVAAALGMKRNAVWVMLHRARTTLKECIEQKLNSSHR